MNAYSLPGISSIDEIIANSFEVSLDEMKSPVRSKKREPTETRKFAMWWRERNTKD